MQGAHRGNAGKNKRQISRWGPECQGLRIHLFPSTPWTVLPACSPCLQMKSPNNILREGKKISKMFSLSVQVGPSEIRRLL